MNYISCRDAVDALAESWASIDGRLSDYRRERDESISRDDPTYTGRFDGYQHEAQEMIRRLRRRGYAVVANPTTQNTIAADVAVVPAPAVPATKE